MVSRIKANRKLRRAMIFRLTKNAFILLLLCAAVSFAQSARPQPTPEPQETPDVILTEEIKVNVSILDRAGKFAVDVMKDDLVVSEDGILHQPSSLRKLPASVLILLDTGGENRLEKNITTTRLAAQTILLNLKDGGAVAVMQYHDRVETICDWTADRDTAIQKLKPGVKFGKRSGLTVALKAAAEMLGRQANVNRHIIIIGDGMESVGTANERDKALQKLLDENINIHALSYTKMELTALSGRSASKTVSGGGKRPPVMPEEAKITLPQDVQRTMNYPRIGSITLDPAMKREIKRRNDNLKDGERKLTEMAENTGGELYLPDTREELIENAVALAWLIDSQYVLTYVPKRPLSESKTGEARKIDVTARRAGLDVVGRRKLVVSGKQ